MHIYNIHVNAKVFIIYMVITLVLTTQVKSVLDVEFLLGLDST